MVRIEIGIGFMSFVLDFGLDHP